MSFRSKDLAVHVLEEKRLWLGCPNTGGPGPQEPPLPCPNSKPPCPNSGCPQNTKRPGGGRAVAGGLDDLRLQLRQALS